MIEESQETRDSIISNLQRHVTEIRDLIGLIVGLVAFFAGIILALFEALANKRLYVIFAYSLSGLIVGMALFIFFKKRKKKKRIEITPPKGAAFRGLLPFEEADRNKFYGREIDHDALFQMVSYSEFRFGVLTGESGCGKTSLLKAGLIPRLREANFLPIYLRLYKEPQETIQRAVQIESGVATAPTDDLKVYLQRVTDQSGKTLVLICDQFEEFFIYFRTKRSRETFIAFVTACCRSSALPIKFLFTLREDALFRISEFDGSIPEPLGLKKRYHLKNFDELEAAQIIERSVQQANLHFEQNLSFWVAKDLAVHNVVLPTELQIVCQRIQNERIFTTKKYQQTGGKENLVYGYLQDILRASDDEEGAKIVLRSIISEENTKLVLSLTEISERSQKSKSRIENILNTFVQARLVKELQDDEPWRYELMHEYLVDKINIVTGKVMDATKRANLAFRQWLIKYDIDRKTRIPLSECLFIKRYTDLPSGSKDKELLAKSLRWGVIRALG